MSQKAGTTIRISDDITDAVRVALAERKVKLTPLVNKFLREWLSDPAQVGVPVVQTPVDSALKTALTLVKQIDILEAKSRDLAREVEDAATYLRGIIQHGNTSTNAGTTTGSERMEEGILREMAAADSSAGAAIEYAAPRHRDTAGVDKGVASERKMNRPRKAK